MTDKPTAVSVEEYLREDDGMSTKARKFPKTLLVVDDNNADEPYWSIEDNFTMAEENAKCGLVATYQLMKVEKLTRTILRKSQDAHG